MERGQREESQTIQTTIGDLVAAISDIALKAGKTEAEGYELASLALHNILKKNQEKVLNTVS